jgi:hypothetical protein
MTVTLGVTTSSMRLNAASVRKNTMSKRARAISAPPVKRKRARDEAR